MAKVHYSENQVNEFIEAAQEMGVGPAMRSLGYPSNWSTAQRWFKSAGLELPSVDSLAVKAAELKQFYSDKEKLFAVQTNIDRIVESLQQDKLSADDLNKLSNALQKNIQTFNLIEGKATNVSETRSKDASDLAVMDMIMAAKAKNALIEQEQEN